MVGRQPAEAALVYADIRNGLPPVIFTLVVADHELLHDCFQHRARECEFGRVPFGSEGLDGSIRVLHGDHCVRARIALSRCRVTLERLAPGRSVFRAESLVAAHDGLLGRREFLAVGFQDCDVDLVHGGSSDASLCPTRLKVPAR